MKRIFFFFPTLLLFCNLTFAQVTGSAEVCAGYVYTYTVSVSGATTYNWTTPSGWIITGGQGSGTLQTMCNQNIRDVCVDALDAGGGLISTQCLTTHWGSGGSGWDVIGNPITGTCWCSFFTLSVIPNSSICTGTCGNGIASPNTYFAIFDNILPTGNYVGPVSTTVLYPVPDPTQSTTYYVYLIDTTLGLANFVLLSGGNCAASVSNSFTVYGCEPPLVLLASSSNPACVGDTITITDFSGNLASATAINWGTSGPELTLVSGQGVISASFVVTSTSSFAYVEVWGTYFNGCMIYGMINLDLINCGGNLPVASFNSVPETVCPGECLSFTNTSQNATSYQWLFPGAIPPSTTNANPSNICYSTSGNYDVTLIATGTGGTDTLVIPNRVNVLTNFPSSLSLINDTVFVNNNFVSYQWYINGILAPLYTSNFCPVSVDGDYSVVLTDVNGCISSSVMIGVIAGIKTIREGKWNVYPNPASDYLILNSDDALKEENRARLLDMTGQIVKDEIIDDSRFAMDVRNLSSGVYTLQIIGRSAISTMKVIIK